MVDRKRTATYSRQTLFWDSVLPSWQGRTSAQERWDESSVVIESVKQDDKSVPSPVIPIRIVLAGIPFGIFFSCEISSELAKNSHIVETRECVWKWGEWVSPVRVGFNKPQATWTRNWQPDDWLITCAAKRRFSKRRTTQYKFWSKEYRVHLTWDACRDPWNKKKTDWRAPKMPKMSSSGVDLPVKWSGWKRFKTEYKKAVVASSLWSHHLVQVLTVHHSNNSSIFVLAPLPHHSLGLPRSSGPKIIVVLACACKIQRPLFDGRCPWQFFCFIVVFSAIFAILLYEYYVPTHALRFTGTAAYSWKYSNYGGVLEMMKKMMTTTS